MTDEEAEQVALLIREHSLWLTEQIERDIVYGHLDAVLLSEQALSLHKRLAERRDVTVHAPNVLTGYITVRYLHFARRGSYYKRGGIHLEMIAKWTSPDWTYNLFPLPASDMDTVTLQYIADAMHSEVDLCTEWDSVPLGRVLHVAHMLVSHQEADGLWPSILNLRTGQAVSTGRSRAPRQLMRRLNRTLHSTEFDAAIRRIEAGMSDAERNKEGIQGWDVK